MQKPTQKKITQYLEIGIAVTAAVLIVLCILLIREYQNIYIREHISAHGPAWLVALHHHPQSLGTDDVTAVKTWMTFDYINHLFALPPGYLQTKLQVTDTRYPRLTIAQYADKLGVADATELVQVQDAIRVHFAPPQQ